LTSAIVESEWSALTRRPLYPRYPFDRRLGGPHSQSGRLVLPELELRPLRRPARSQSLYRLRRTALSQLLTVINKDISIVLSYTFYYPVNLLLRHLYIRKTRLRRWNGPYEYRSETAISANRAFISYRYYREEASRKIMIG
jgi:hypothetical protein